MNTGLSKDDISWREELKSYTTSKYELDLLENGAHNLPSSWRLGALHNKWKKLNGYVEKEPPNCQSSFKEWNEGISG